MPSRSFVVQKLIGREFEQAMIPVLESMGMRVIDTDSWSYRLKRGRDCIVEVKGQRNGIDFKYDKLSEQSGRVCVDVESLQHTDSAIWVFGLPRGSEIDCYALKTSDLAPYTYQYARMNPGAVLKVGEFKQAGVMIPKSIFTKLPFINKFKTIELV
jgi:hypothetical protein